MITLEDCCAFCEAGQDDVDRILRQEHLPAIVALACAHNRVSALAVSCPPPPATPAPAPVKFLLAA